MNLNEGIRWPQAGRFAAAICLLVLAWFSCRRTRPAFRFIPQSADYVMQFSLPLSKSDRRLPAELRADLERAAWLTGSSLEGHLWVVPFPAGPGEEVNLLLLEPRARANWKSRLDDRFATAAERYSYRGVELFRLGDMWTAYFKGVVLMGQRPFLLEDAIAQQKDSSPHPFWRSLSGRAPEGASFAHWFNRAGWQKGVGGLARSLPLEGLVAGWSEPQRPDTLALVEGAYRIKDPLPTVAGDSLRKLLDAAPAGLGWMLMQPKPDRLFPGAVCPQTGLFNPKPESPAAQVGLLMLTGEAAAADWSVRQAQQQSGYAPEQYQLFELFRLPDGALPSSFWPDAFESAKASWMAQADRYVFLAQEREVLERCLDAYLTGQVLGRDPLALSMRPPLEGQAAAWLWLRPGASLWSPFSFLEAAFFELANGRLSGKGLLAGRDLGFGSSMEFAWRRRLDAPVVWGPYAAFQGGKAQVFVQDATHRLYALDGASGRQHWSYELPRRLLPGMVVVPGRLPGAYWIGACSRGQLFLIDENGRDKPPFPLIMETEATAGPARLPQGSLSGDVLLVPAANGGIYGYAQNGTPLRGWSPRWGIGKVRQQLNAVRFGTQTFIIARTEDRYLHMLDRSGKVHFPPDSLDGNSLSPVGVQILDGNARLVVGLSSGLVRVFNLRGQSFNLRLTPGEAVRFLFADLMGDARRDYLSGEGDRLRLHTYRGDAFEQVAETALPFAADTLYAIDLGHTKRSLGVWNRSGRKAVVLDSSLQVREYLLFSADRPLLGIPQEGRDALILTCLADELTAFRPAASR
jgi:hypothetical protein